MTEIFTMKTFNEELLNHDVDTQDGYAPVEVEDTSSLTEIKEPFDPKKIDIDTKTPSLDLMIKRLRSNPPAIDLYPDFQRKGGIWGPVKESQLIESILMRLPLPAFYFDGSDENKWLVVDGLQRLTTLKNFIIDEAFALEHLEFLTQLKGKYFRDLPVEFQRRIEETQIVAYIIKPGTPEDVKFNIFKRINTGGEPLTPQEIRHALNQGLPAMEIAKLTKIPAFRQATGNINPDRMLDRDFVNRFVAFYLTPYEKYEPDLDIFLNKGMRKLKEPDINLGKLEYDFTHAMHAAHAIFDKYAFRKHYAAHGRRNPLSKALFEVWSVALAILTDNQRKILIDYKHEVVDGFIKIMNEDEIFRNAVSQATGDKSRVIKRYSTIEKLIEQILSQHAETITS
jgi:hypothetical protein